ncbi:MAG TPA: biotin/lipoyl-binding protein, partial [Tepidisphaeraceae bacterium]|nr:biotin/lipoyl-binding protein [Tepidisphaeraceae bacterium]
MSRVPPQRPGNGHPPEDQVVETRVVPSRADIPVPPESFGRGEPPKSEQKADDQKKNQEQEKPPLYKRPWFWAIVGVIVIVIAVVGVLWYLHAKGKLSTDDAFIEAHITNVAPRVAGHVLEVLVTDNQQVKAGQVLVRLDPID